MLTPRDAVGFFFWVDRCDNLAKPFRQKSQSQALDRTQKSLPLFPGRLKTMTHDYKRNGTTTLFAAIDLAEGRIIAECMPRHRHQEWLTFLTRVVFRFPFFMPQITPKNPPKVS
jgi:hypothetical protein